MNALPLLAALLLGAPDTSPPPVHLWLEPEWFEGVRGHFAYWTGKATPTGAWGIAGPGISAEWSQGGESEWNSMGAAAEETNASCRRRLVVPRTGKYRVWVRYVDHRRKGEPFRVRLSQQKRAAFDHEFGVKAIVPENDEYQLFWGFSFGWDHGDTQLAAGPAELEILIDRAGEAWRQVDAVLITDDRAFVPVGREKPTFAYEASFARQPTDGAAWRGIGKGLSSAPAAARLKLDGRDFTMWAGIENDPKWWGKQPVDKLSLDDVFFEFAPPKDIRDKFHKQFAERKHIPLVGWPGLVPGLYLGTTPDLSPGTPVRQWLERTKSPFFVVTNYANPRYDDKTGPATHDAFAGPLRDQILGFIHGEAVGTPGVRLPDKALGDRRSHVDQLEKQLFAQQEESWGKMFKTKADPELVRRGISCLSTDSIALAHAFHHLGARTVGYEIDATNAHAPMRIAFERGAARQFKGAWINYASGNFGDACNYFSQQPVVPRGAPSWFHSKYSITDGVSIAWYRKLYYLNYLGGASAIYWEQNLHNQWILPGPGTHPVQLSPFGRVTQDFQAFVDRVGDRGEPVTPIGLLLSYGHGYERVNYHCKMLDVFQEDAADLELRELFSALWYPASVLEGKPASPDAQSMPAGVYGDIFDVLVDRPEEAHALSHYPVIVAAGDVELGGALLPHVEAYVRKGGTLVVPAMAAKKLPASLTGLKLQGRQMRSEAWLADGDVMPTTPALVEAVELGGAKAILSARTTEKTDVPLVTRHAVGDGVVLVPLVPRCLGIDERLHPAIPYLLNGLTQKLLPIDVRLANGERPRGEVQYQVNRTRDGYLALLVNPRGIDKTQTGIARVDRRASVDVVLSTSEKIASAEELTGPAAATLEQRAGLGEVRVTIPAGDLKVIHLRK